MPPLPSLSPNPELGSFLGLGDRCLPRLQELPGGDGRMGSPSAKERVRLHPNPVACPLDHQMNSVPRSGSSAISLLAVLVASLFPYPCSPGPSPASSATSPAVLRCQQPCAGAVPAPPRDFGFLLEIPGACGQLWLLGGHQQPTSLTPASLLLRSSWPSSRQQRLRVLARSLGNLSL